MQPNTKHQILLIEEQSEKNP